MMLNLFLVLLMTSCKTMIIEIQEYEEINIKEIEEKTLKILETLNEEQLKAVLYIIKQYTLQIKNMSIYIDELNNQIILSDGHMINVIDLRNIE